MDHGSRVDGFVIMLGDARAVTVGEPEGIVWDLFSSGSHLMRNCAKAVTCAGITNSGD